MSKRTILIAAAMLAMCACESRREHGTQPAEEERAERERTGPLEREALPQPEHGTVARRQEREERVVREQEGTVPPPRTTTGTQGYQPTYPQGTGQPSTRSSEGEIATFRSQDTLSNTVSRLNRELRNNDMQPITTVRYNRSTRERMLHRGQPSPRQGTTGAQQGVQGTQQGMQGTPQQGTPQGTPEARQGTPQGRQGTQQGMQGTPQGNQQGMQGTPQGRQQGMQGEQAGVQGTMGAQAGTVGDVRLVLFRRAGEEMRAIEDGGAVALLELPHVLVVYESDDGVMISYRVPPQTVPMGLEESTADILNRVATNVTEEQPRRQASARERREPIAQREPEATGIEMGTEDIREPNTGAMTPESERQAANEPY